MLKSLFFWYALSVHRYLTIIKGFSCLETKIMLFYFYEYSQDFRNYTKLLGSDCLNRVGRVTVNKHIILFGLT